jgi:Domain of unknown function (DUF4265)
MSDTKVILTYKVDENNFETESVWATKVGKYYKIDNIPFFSENISLGDIVSVEEDEGELHLDELIEPSGHSTLQIVIFDEAITEELQQQLESYGCSWEGSHVATLISVDIPRETSYIPIKKYLDEGEERALWSYKEACLAHEY